MREPTMLHRLAAEFIGTFWLVLGGCGSAVFAAKFASDDGFSLGIGFLGVSLAFGLTVLTGVYAFGTISVDTSTRPSHSALRWPGGSSGRRCPRIGSRRWSVAWWPKAKRAGPRQATWQPTVLATIPPAATRCGR